MSTDRPVHTKPWRVWMEKWGEVSMGAHSCLGDAKLTSAAMFVGVSIPSLAVSLPTWTVWLSE